MRVIIALLVVLVSQFSANANDGILVNAEPNWLVKTNPDLSKKPVATSISGGYYYDLIEEQVNLVSNIEYHHTIKHIVNETGVQNGSEVSVSFSPEFQHVIFHKLLIIRNGSTVNALNAKQIKIVQEETDASNFEYNGIKRAFVTLKDIQKGDKIDVSYSIVGFNPVFRKRYSSKTYFLYGTEICNYFMTIIVEQERKLYIDTFNKAPRPSEQLSGNLRIYSWNNPLLKARDNESGSPSWFTDDPYVSVTEFSSWKEVVAWGLQLFNDYKYELPAGLKNRINDWRKASAGDKDMFANLALRFVQDEIRYLGLEIGEHTHRPHTPAEVYTRRFGDCKDKALLLATILQHENISAYVALVNSDVIKTPESEPAAPTAFDHAIVAIERSSGYIFVDPTVSMQRGELINLYIPDYGYALIVKQGQEKLFAVEAGFLFNTSIKEELNVKYGDSSRFKVETVFSGGAADNTRREFSESSSKEIEDSYEEFYSKIYDGITIQRPVVMKDDSTKNEITVTENYAIPKIWQTGDKGKKFFEVYARLLAGTIPDPSSSSNEPLALSYPRSLHYILEINMPESWGFDVGSLHVKNDYFQFDFVPVVRDSRITLSYDFKTFKDHIPVEALAMYKKDYKNINDKLDFEIYKHDFYTSEQSDIKPVTNVNVYWPAIWFTFLFIVLMTALLRKLNNKESQLEYDYQQGWPLGGWVIFLGGTIALAVIIQVVSIVKVNYFNAEIWARLETVGGKKLQYVTMLELACNLFSIAGAAGLIYWFIGRRDIFPKMFVWYICGILIVKLILIIVYSSVSYPSSFGNLEKDSLIQLFRTLVYAAIWIPYVLRSERARNTFVHAGRYRR